jgi:hypothetical protein
LLGTRGPNSDCENGDEKGFSVPAFAPAFFELRANKASGKVEMVASCHLKDGNGKPLTGGSLLAGPY